MKSQRPPSHRNRGADQCEAYAAALRDLQPLPVEAMSHHQAIGCMLRHGLELAMNFKHAWAPEQSPS